MERNAGDLARLDEAVAESLERHAVICGYGRVGQLSAPPWSAAASATWSSASSARRSTGFAHRGVPAIFGDASNPVVSQMANIATARLVVVATPDPNETRLIVERALDLHPGIDFVVRTHNDHEAARLRALSTRIQAIHGERELAVQMARYSLRRFGVSATEAEAIAQGLRGHSVVAATAARQDGGIRAWLAGYRDSSGDRRRRLGVRPRRSRVHQHRPLVRDDRLVALVEAAGPDADEALAGTRPRRPHLEHLRFGVERVAREDRGRELARRPSRGSRPRSG